MDSTAQSAGNKPPAWYWIVSALALVWMLFGVMSWVMDLMMDEAALAQMSEAQQQLYRARPDWIFVLYAIAIFGGLAGAIGLLMRRRWSVTAFAVSLIAVIVQFGYILGVMNTIELLGFATAATFPIVIFAIGAALLWFATHAKKSGWFTA